MMSGPGAFRVRTKSAQRSPQFLQLLPDETACEKRRAQEQSPPKLSIAQPSDGEIDNRARHRRRSSRALDDLRNSAPIGKQIALNQHRLPQLSTNFVMASPAISPRKRPLVARGQRGD